MTANVHALSFPRTASILTFDAKPPHRGDNAMTRAATPPAHSDEMAAADTPEARAHRVVAEKSAAIAEAARIRRERFRAFVLYVFPPIAGIALLILVWRS
jgi:hypothetical protein